MAILAGDIKKGVCLQSLLESGVFHVGVYDAGKLAYGVFCVNVKEQTVYAVGYQVGMTLDLRGDNGYAAVQSFHYIKWQTLHKSTRQQNVAASVKRVYIACMP